ncbi:hypothetical protein HNY73_001427 [Argiope bruennichi]|uniref:Uncharacterized protein n=1 Tax=Argiope bruennichi TaxID=94029 RepID=A0A8T0G196_ARGBR|nr:hypothetical protein HNY73_001427 [Argiope bruennichi]
MPEESSKVIMGIRQQETTCSLVLATSTTSAFLSSSWRSTLSTSEAYLSPNPALIAAGVLYSLMDGF